MLELHAAFEVPGIEPHEGDAITVLGVHVGLDFEHHPGDFGFKRIDGALVGDLRTRRRRIFGQPVEQLAHPKIVHRRAEKHRRHGAFQIRLMIERRAQAARHFDVFAQLRRRMFGQQLVQQRIVEAGDLDPAPIWLPLVRSIKIT